MTQPRVTCYRVGIRMNEPQMAALLVAQGRPGFYFRVLEEGEVEAGDEIVQVATGPECRPSSRSTRFCICRSILLASWSGRCAFWR